MTSIPTPSASPNNPHLQAPLHGSCECSKVTYALTAGPIRVNCCHCLDCQAQSGTAFATNLIIEHSHIDTTSSPTRPTTTVYKSGKTITRCGDCHAALWSTYPSAGPGVVFVRAGTLVRGGEVRPDVHIYTRSKVAWVTLPEGVKQYVADTSGESDVWSVQGRRRIEAVLGRKTSC